MFRSSIAAKSIAKAATPKGVRTYATGKDIKYGVECRAKMLIGVEQLARAVSVTLGPKGRNVIIDQSYGSPKITKDGVTVAKNIEFADRHVNLGAQLVRGVASKTNDVAGDGTTTATVLTRAIFAEGCKAVATGVNPMDLRRGITAAVDEVVKQLKVVSRPINTKEEIAQVATISANGDSEIGQLIANAMEKVGKEGVITVQDGKTLKDELEIIEGMSIDQGFLSRYFVTDAKNQKTEMEDALILLCDKKITSAHSLVPLLEMVGRERKKLLIIAENIENEALAMLILNRARGFPVVAVKAPGFGDNRKVLLQDLATITGAEVISEELGLKLESVELKQFGTAKKVIVSQNDTVFLNGGGAKEAVEERIQIIRDSIGQTVSEYEKEKLQERLAKLAGGVAILKVGGASEVEVGEKKDRITDALNATKAAVEEGIVPGGGVALLMATKSLEKMRLANSDQDVGIKIIRDALKVPARTIADNAGVEGAVVVGKLLENTNHEFGYNAQTGTYENMIKAGIVDPTKVVRTALQDAAGVASLMTTTEAMIVDLPRDESKSSAPPAGMGGMGGMGDF